MQHKEEPEVSELQDGLARVNLKAPETDQEPHEEQGDMEKEVLDDPAADQEQEDDDSMLEEEPGKAEEMSEMKARADEPEGESIEKNQVVPESYAPETEEEGPALDSMGEKMRSLEEYFPNEEARVDYSLVNGLETDFGPAEEKKAVAAMADEGVEGVEGAEAAAQRTVATRQSNCPGVILYGKCYQFFREPKRAESAELFCQDRFPGGHLASITNAFVHRELMNLIRQNGLSIRTWIGGLRYLQTNRFIWLDGSQWNYEDWLSGEPNHTSGLENCVELLPYGNGKFNDFTCWEPQAFICSYPYH
ncbi:uncharacterized protein LOC142897626 [Nelusetta ayraudi]|uniref:uncharacterized protein LOC142897626 n=1 Tax=Nelusetta ayraudi TaxID=303726 RepID=UPI003F7219A8